MQCPFCGHEETKVTDSRLAGGGVQIRRRRECLKCGARYTTYEEIEKPKKLRVLREDKGSEDFSHDKLRTSLERVCYNLPIDGEQMDEVIERIFDDLATKWGRADIPRREIADRVMAELRALNKVAYIRYVSFVRQFKEPEEFLNEIKKLEKPYDTLTQRLPGV